MKPLFSTGRAIMGDLLRAALWCARKSPNSPAGLAVWKTFDQELTRLSAPRLSLRDIQLRVRALTTPRVAPITVHALDWPLIIRAWRACFAFGHTGFRIGSADAIGFGYGALLTSAGTDKYFVRGEPTDTPGIYLGLCPSHLPLAHLRQSPKVQMRVDTSGLTIGGILGDKAGFKELSATLHSWLIDQGRITTDLEKASLRAANFEMRTTPQGWQLNARTPEALIRLSAQCAAGALLAFIPDDNLGGKNEAVLSFLRPTDEAPASLAAERHSRSGPLADWLRLPPLPIVLNLTLESRTALDAVWASSAKETVL